MDIVGGGKVHVYPAEDEGSHPAGPQPQWQESVVLVWWDMKQAIGGFFRVGHEPNCEGGPMVTLWSNVVTPEGVYKQTRYQPLRDEDRSPRGFGSGDGTLRYEYDGNCVWTLRDDDISADLRVHDFHPSIDCYPKKGNISEFAPHHMEVAGKVGGTLTVKGRTYEVDALSFRDHGWGERVWNTLLSHRWLSGVFGEDLSFCALSWHGVDDAIMQFGWVVRKDKVIYASKLDMVAYVECDAMTTRGGHLRMTLTTGEVLEVEFEAVAPCLVSYHHGVSCADTLCKITCNGQVGIGDFETTHNCQHGTRRPGRLSRGVIENGWHPA